MVHFCHVGILIPTACVTDLTDTLKRIAVQAAGTAAVEDTTNATPTTTSTPSSSSSPTAVITVQDQLACVALNRVIISGV